MKKSYSHFTAEELSALGICAIKDYLFKNINPQNPSDWLLETFGLNQEIPMVSEKARSELLITPILIELRKKIRILLLTFPAINSILIQKEV